MTSRAALTDVDRHPDDIATRVGRGERQHPGGRNRAGPLIDRNNDAIGSGTGALPHLWNLSETEWNRYQAADAGDSRQYQSADDLAHRGARYSRAG